MTGPHLQNLHETKAGESLSGSPLYNEDFAPVPAAARNWSTWNFASLWIGMAVCIPTYMLAGSMIGEGMNWWQALLTILLGNLVVLLPMILNAHAGTKYGLPLPVLLRASFGTKGAVFAALMRGLVGCGWFGIQTWIGGEAIYMLLLVPFPDLANVPVLAFIGLNTAQLACFLAFWLLNMWIIFRGIETIRLLESWTAPLLLLMGVALLAWAINKVGSLQTILEASHQMKGQEKVAFWKIFWPNLTAMVGFWATLSLNIPDFSRYARNQKAQVLGQAIGLPPTMVFYSFIGIAVTSATLLIFGEAIWDPVQLLGRFSSPVVVVISMLGLTIATLSTNIAANVVASANDIANIAPSKISFRMGGYITGLIGILIFPWKLLADPQGFIFVWLIGYSALLGALAGVMICDYYIIRKRRLNIKSLFASDGAYGRWNRPAWIALSISLLPVLPGFLAQTAIISSEFIPDFLKHIYAYAWFVTFFLAFAIYWILKTKVMNRSSLFFSINLILLMGVLSTTYASNPTASQSRLTPVPTVTDLAGLVNERLSYMKDVAAYKWQNQLPIEDLEREQIVIQNSIEQAAAFGLDSASTQSFFEEQISAAKLIQQYWFDQWEANGFDQQMNFRDLNTEVRPALIELGNQILAAISEVKLWEKPEAFIYQERFNFITSLTSEGLGFHEKRLLFEALIQIKGIPEEEPIFQVSRLDSLSIGRYEGKTTYGALKNYGDFGLGTFNNIDGEMIAVDGQFYQVKTDGQAVLVKKSLKTPFAVVTKFDKDLEFKIDKSMSLSKLLDVLSSKLESLDGYYAIRIDGSFERTKTRSVYSQQKPFPPLSEVVAGQVIFELENVQGTMVGYYLPEEVGSSNAKGYHFHFLTADRKAGGHLLDGMIQNAVVSIDISSGLKSIKEPGALSKQ